MVFQYYSDAQKYNKNVAMGSTIRKKKMDKARYGDDN